MKSPEDEIGAARSNLRVAVEPGRRIGSRKIAGVPGIERLQRSGRGRAVDESRAGDLRPAPDVRQGAQLIGYAEGERRS